MKCVIKNTTKIIDGSENPIEIMLENAQNSGFAENEVEILTEEEYLARKELEPVPPKEATEIDLLKQKNESLQNQLASINSDLQGFMDFYFTTL